MGPTELIVSAVITLGTLVPAVAYLEGFSAPQKAPDTKIRYTMDRQCEGPKGPGPCVVSTETGEPIGLSPQ